MEWFSSDWHQRMAVGANVLFDVDIGGGQLRKGIGQALQGPLLTRARGEPLSERHRGDPRARKGALA
jgi:hypothetical protein